MCSSTSTIFNKYIKSTASNLHLCGKGLKGGWGVGGGIHQFFALMCTCALRRQLFSTHCKNKPSWNKHVCFILHETRACKIKRPYACRGSATWAEITPPLLLCTPWSGCTALLYCTVYTALYCTVLHCTVLYCTVLHCTVVYCTVLHCTALYVQYSTVKK